MMWTMGYNDAGEFNSIQDPFSSRKLRPLVPRPATIAAAASPPCLTRIHGTDLLALNHHLAMAEQNKKEINAQQVVVSSRWNPTPEQLQTLEELYRRGTRTPSAEQIQHITSQLRRYGKIEGKNVFYWFQNHKARERQKRRRQLESLSDDKNNNNNNNHVENGEKREPPGANKTVFEDEQTRNWPSPANSSIIAEKNGAKKTECKLPDGWIQFDDDAELQQRKTATWQMIHNLSCCSSSSPPTNLVNSSSTPAANSTIIPPTTLTPMETKPEDFINIFLGHHINTQNLSHSAGNGRGGGEEAQTLQLFPLRSGGRHCLNYEYGGDEAEEEEEESGAAMNHVTYPFQFIEFLPLKN
ncbi:hypothetical protein CDL12_23719 [Handroanthus impetiginosus]|uniref:Homeobox domain-containing protein n=1 Tax=Handroanthus impetiginosus TaxID=429701 RepID=A0A2G9GEN6_9LAMI|nr:hypothetical protein CDL12_23719 [Handroanthus impetiginosus]